MKTTWALISLVAAFMITPVGSAGTPTLEESATAIERAASAPDGTRIVLGHLSRKLAVSVDTLRVERTQTGLGWGEILIAHRLAEQSGLTVDQITAEFRGGKSWEEIARNHKVDLEKLSRDVQLSQEMIERRSEDKGLPRIESSGPPSGGGRRPR